MDVVRIQAVTYRALSQSLQQLLFNGFFQTSSHEGLALPDGFAPVHLLIDCYELTLFLLFQLAHADEVLCDLGKALLALVNCKLGPVQQLLVNLTQGLLIVAAQLDLLPQVTRRMCPFNGLDKEIADT